MQVAIVRVTASFETALSVLQHWFFACQLILPFFKENTFHAFKNTTQFQVSTVSILYITDSKPFFQNYYVEQVFWGSE